jgi:hypothetical protein
LYYIHKLDIFGVPLSFTHYDKQAVYKTPCGGFLTIAAMGFLLVTAMYDLDAFMKDSEPYIKMISGLIDPKKDFEGIAYYSHHAYLPYMRIFEKNEGANINYTEFKKHLAVDFFAQNGTVMLGTDLCINQDNSSAFE